jgi:hypothetical protein
MLERVQAVVSKLCDIFARTPDAEDAARIPRRLVGWIWIV